MTILCSQCGNPFLRWVRQNGPFDRLLGFLFVHSFRCQICRHRFHALRWGIRFDREPGDRRQYDRRPVRFPVTLCSPFGEQEGRITDLAMGGCSIAALTHYRMGDALSLRLDALDETLPIDVDRAVIRTVSQGRLGVEFLGFSDQAEARLRELMLTLWIEGTPTAWRRRWENAWARMEAIGEDLDHGTMTPMLQREDTNRP